METSAVPKTCPTPSSSTAFGDASRINRARFCNQNPYRGIKNARCLVFKTRAVSEVIVESLNSSPVEVSWEIIVGSIAGTAPFVVAGVEFSKRINAQRNCTTCKGSGLVRREKYFFRCPRCGGFLPWQSWRRFFTG